MTDRPATGPSLLRDLRAQVAILSRDLRTRSDDPHDPWAQALRAEFDGAVARGRTGLSWTDWSDGEVDAAAVAWVLGTVFVRFCEDNGLIDGPWLSGPGTGRDVAADNESAFYAQDPTRNARDWLRAGFAALADSPGGRGLLARQHSPVWRAPIGADAAAGLIAFWREQDASGALVHDLTDASLDTRLLGDLYQDLSEYAKKRYALLQTPVFVEEFILDRTLTPALEQVPLADLRLIDPTCGSGHFLLGAFDRLLAAWQAKAPAMDRRERVQKALDAIHGVDLNPFAIAIARFRLTVAALQASGLTRLKDAPAFAYHLAIGDSLIHGGVQGDLLAAEDDAFSFLSEDITEHPGILERGRYNVVVGNPPYITVKDKALNERYRQDYRTCHRQYALSVPFMELFFALAVKPNDGTPAGWVGQITSNSFMKREFGSKVIEDLLSGQGALAYENPVDLTYVIDTSGAYIPGHGTPTVILIGRHRRPTGDTVRAVLGVRGEPGQPDDPANALVWSEIRDHVEHAPHDGTYVTVTDMPRAMLATHPWSLSGGGASALLEVLQASATSLLGDAMADTGRTTHTGNDPAFFLARSAVHTRGLLADAVPLVEGESVRDFTLSPTEMTLFPYDNRGEPRPLVSPGAERLLWLNRTALSARVDYQQTLADRGLRWFDHSMFFPRRYRNPLSLVFAFVATHNHFVLDRGGKVFNRSAPVIKLPEGATEEQYLDLLGVLNSSAACFWLKQVSHNKGEGGGARVDAGYAAGGSEPWKDTYEFTGTKLAEFPLPADFPSRLAAALDDRARYAAQFTSAAVLADGGPGSLATPREKWRAIRAQMIFLQEELDWEVYRAYGLLDEDLTYAGGGIDAITLGERAFEISLARKVADGTEETAWFERHGSTPITEVPASWPGDYRDLVQRRLDLIASDPFIGLLERPEYKRRWNSPTWDDQLPGALRDFVLDRLEEPSLWSDASGPRVASVAQLADRVRGDEQLVEAVRMLRGAVEVDLTRELGALLADEAVPYLAAHRYKDPGLRKRAEWEAVWDLQRREDAGEKVTIPVPPKYGSGDFRKTSYWKARGKLDVPKERFISYPGVARRGDTTLILGWAGWDHLEQARALARLLAELAQGDPLSRDQALALVAGLVELEPWLHQWYAEPDPAFGGTSPAAFFTGYIDQQLAGISATRADAQAWGP